MKNNVGFVIQGPTTHVDQMIKSFSNYKSVLWSTWENEPKENLKKIKKSNIKLLTNKLPKYKGVGHINYQCLSSYKGIKELSKNKNIKIFVKCRQDLLISNLEQFVRNVNNSLIKYDISFLSAHKLKGGYLQDYIVAGKKKQMLKFWKPELKKDTGLPSPERWLQTRFFEKDSKKNWNVYHENLSFISLNGTKIYSLKWNFYINDYPLYLYRINDPSRKRGFLFESYYLLRWLIRKYLLKKMPVQTSKKIRKNREKGKYTK